MLGEHGIISLSPELGDPENLSKRFYPPKSVINKILDFDYKAIELFFEKSVPFG